MAKLSTTFIFTIFLAFCWIGPIPNSYSVAGDSELNAEILLNQSDLNFNESELNIRYVSDDEGNKETKRTKRNALLATNGINSPTSVEGLLSSCQLTNLLLYQLLNQRINSPIGASGLAGLPNNIQPFPAAAGLLGLGVPAPANFFAPVLQTYTTTSIYQTEITTTSVHTITLLFGNKESMTTVTQTKLINATTSTVLTLTSTVQPITTALPNPIAEIKPTATSAPNILPSKYYEDEQQPNEIVHKNLHLQAPTFKTAIFEAQPQFEQKPARQKQRRKYARQKNVENYGERQSEIEQSPPNSAPFKYGQAVNFLPNKQHLNPTSTAEDDYYYQNSYNDRNEYVRRLKRRGEMDELITLGTSHDSQESYENPEPYLEREYLLEPSSDASFAENVAVQACPFPKEITITKTVTKYVNPPLGNSVGYKGGNDYTDESGRYATRTFDSEKYKNRNVTPVLPGTGIRNENEKPRRTPLGFNSKNPTTPDYNSVKRERGSSNNRFATTAATANNNRDLYNIKTQSSARPRDSDIIRSINENRRSSRYRNSGSNNDQNISSTRSGNSSSEKKSDGDITSRFRFTKRTTLIKK